MSSSGKKGPVAFPSVSTSLNSLHNAKTMGEISMHPSMYAQRAKESEALLRQSLTKPGHPSTPCAQPTLAAPMMRTPVSAISLSRLRWPLRNDCADDAARGHAAKIKMSDRYRDSSRTSLHTSLARLIGAPSHTLSPLITRLLSTTWDFVDRLAIAQFPPTRTLYYLHLAFVAFDSPLHATPPSIS
ncbi:unnamed protein product [Mycena citricolor]|uniref:Uncharacterized protein n=1 Tax=Mycena citricolor TaxID=2018698 RepID=A0AAD2Q4C0_9AGAR|nr:unnamed protein product [Mycena citricolor]